METIAYIGIFILGIGVVIGLILWKNKKDLESFYFPLEQVEQEDEQDPPPPKD